MHGFTLVYLVFTVPPTLRSRARSRSKVLPDALTQRHRLHRGSQAKCERLSESGYDVSAIVAWKRRYPLTCCLTGCVKRGRLVSAAPLLAGSSRCEGRPKMLQVIPRQCFERWGQRFPPKRGMLDMPTASASQVSFNRLSSEEFPAAFAASYSEYTYSCPTSWATMAVSSAAESNRSAERVIRSTARPCRPTHAWAGSITFTA